MTTTPRDVIGGVEMHAETHHAAVIDTSGKHLGDAKFPTVPAGYVALAAFLIAYGTVIRVGVEGTGLYGAALTRHLREVGLEVVEVIRPNRQIRCMRGKSEPIDAYAAATTALAAADQPAPKITTGTTEAIRYLLVARLSAVTARSAAKVQIKSLLITALAPLVQEVSPALAAAKGVGTVTAAQLFRTAGDNPDLLRSEASFANLVGASPLLASSGKTTRHRLNRGGDRHANSAIHRIALVRMSCALHTCTYIEKKCSEGMGIRAAMRALKRAIAREISILLSTHVDVPRIDDLRPLRQARCISLTTAAEDFGVWPMRLSELERRRRRDDDLATTYRQWLTTA